MPRASVRASSLFFPLMLNPLPKTGIFCYMKAIELEKAYDPKTFEGRIYRLWKEQGTFKPEVARGNGKSGASSETFVIESLKVIPIGGSNG